MVIAVSRYMPTTWNHMVLEPSAMLLRVSVLKSDCSPLEPRALTGMSTHRP